MKVYTIVWYHNDYSETTQIEAFRTKKEMDQRYNQISKIEDANITIQPFCKGQHTIRNKSDLVQLLNKLTSAGQLYVSEGGEK